MRTPRPTGGQAMNNDKAQWPGWQTQNLQPSTWDRHQCPIRTKVDYQVRCDTYRDRAIGRNYDLCPLVDPRAPSQLRQPASVGMAVPISRWNTIRLGQQGNLIVYQYNLGSGLHVPRY